MRTNRLMQNAERNRSDGDYLIIYVPAAYSCGRDVCVYMCEKKTYKTLLNDFRAPLLVYIAAKMSS